MCESQASHTAPAAEVGAKFVNKTLQDYEVISVIGNGSFGTCFKVRDKETGEVYAWKGVDYDELSESRKESLVSEINMLKQLQHPNIVQYYHHLVNHEAKSIFIVMECCEGGDLAQLIAKARVERTRFEEKYIWRLLFQICRALQVCHNRIRRGTILHRDIKPANIFLDAAGNAKLGDFGLARMLRRYETFAETFVGTPYYMSPEIVKGVKYDRKSDVWAVGCLIYEMCSLRPPFIGREFVQLSANISNGKFENIPAVYSADLREIIAFMLEVDNDQRPNIEMVSRNPIVIRNIHNLRNEFPTLIQTEPGFHPASDSQARSKLQYSPLTDLSSTAFTQQNSFHVGYGQRRLSFSTIFTPDLRAELFYSTKRKAQRKYSLQQSDPELYASFRQDKIVKAMCSDSKPPMNESPSALTQEVFDDALQKRLHAIRAQECLLKEKEANLDIREQQLQEKEKQLRELELCLQKQVAEMELKTRRMTGNVARTLSIPNNRKLKSKPPPPVPPRKERTKLDDTYCSIEPNDTLLREPTMAKLNIAALPATKSFPTLRKVSFQSPKKFIKYDIENRPPKAGKSVSTKVTRAVSNPNQLRTSVSSKGSDESSDAAHNRRKSILSIFGLQRVSKNPCKPSAAQNATSKPALVPVLRKSEIISKCETTDLANMWTKEHKRAAFDLLAVMNASEREGAPPPPQETRHKFRHSVRERNIIHRNRLRRSLIMVPSQLGGICGRESIAV